MEDLLRERLEAAKANYVLAVGRYYDAMEGQQEFRFSAMDFATVQTAFLSESAALNEYLRALQVFTELTVSR